MLVQVLGCVRTPGKYRLRLGATVRQAVRAAGGLGGLGMVPSGVITIRSRRKSDGLLWLRRRLSYLRHREHLDVVLRPDDLVVVQFDVASPVREGRPAQWPFDQEPNVAAITSVGVIERGMPVLLVVHYEDDHSWAFQCGTTNADRDGRVICMGTALLLDPSLREVADLPPGWIAWRAALGGEWSRTGSRARSKSRTPSDEGVRSVGHRNRRRAQSPQSRAAQPRK